MNPRCTKCYIKLVEVISNTSRWCCYSQIHERQHYLGIPKCLSSDNGIPFMNVHMEELLNS